jgi:hypothetical protein
MATLQSLADAAIADAQSEIDSAVANYQARIMSANSDYSTAVNDAVVDFTNAWNDAMSDWTTGEAGAQAQYVVIEHPAWTVFQSVLSAAESQFAADAQAALDDWTTAEASLRADYDDEMHDAEADWLAAEAAAWSTFTGIETAARAQRDADVAAAALLLNAVVDAATTMWHSTESSARAIANSTINLAESIWTGTQALAFADWESQVSAAEQAAESTITGLQSQANQAWTDYLALLPAGETPIAMLAIASLAFVAPPQPTAEQLANAQLMAQLALAAYPNEILPPNLVAAGWSVAQGYPVMNDRTGFYAVLFQNTNGQFVLAFAGTQMPSMEAWGTNFRQAFGRLAMQYETAIALALQLRAQHGENLQLKGHSLGGGLASAAALVSGDLNATIFNAAGVHPRTVTRHNGSMALANQLITSYRVNGDPLSLMQARVIDPLACLIQGSQTWRVKF